MADKINRRRTSDLIKLLDARATCVVRTKSGLIGNATSLRSALEVAARKSHATDKLAGITSVTRFEDAQIQIPPRQARQLLQHHVQNGTSFGSNPPPTLSCSEPPSPRKRTPYSWLAWTFSRGNSGSASSSSRGEVPTSMNVGENMSRARPLGSGVAD